MNFRQGYSVKLVSALLILGCLLLGTPLYSQEAPSTLPDFTDDQSITLPKAGVTKIAQGLVIAATILSACGLGFLATSVVQQYGNAPKASTFAAISAGFSGVGLGFILVGANLTSPFDQVAVPLE